MDIMTRYILALTSDTSGAREYVTALKRAEESTKMLGVETGKATRLIDQTTTQSFDKSGKLVRRFTTIWQDSFGRVFKTVSEMDGSVTRPISASLNQMGNGFASVANKSNDFVRALRRVIIVVPIWMTFRAVIRGVQTAIRDTVEYVKDMDKALARAKATITDSSINMAQFGEVIRNVARALAVQTGKSIGEVIEIFYRLSTAGIDAKTSLGGMEGVLKTSVAIMGDTESTAKVLAQTYNLLGKNIQDDIPEFKKIELIGAVIARLWQDNQFELNEFNSSLERAGSALSQFGVDARTSIALLATLHQQGIKGSRAGTLLQQVFLRLGKNTKVLRDELGILIKDNAPIDWFELLTQVMDRVNELGTQTPQAVKALLEVFNIRGGQGFRALLQDMNKFRDNLQKSHEDAGALFNNLDKLQDIQLNTVGAQMDIFRNMRKEIGYAFVTGITGTRDFVSGLKIVNAWMKEIAINTAIVSNELREWGEATFGKQPLPPGFGNQIKKIIPFGQIGFFKSEIGKQYAGTFDALKKEFSDVFSEKEMSRFAWDLVNNFDETMAKTPEIAKKYGRQVSANFLDAYNAGIAKREQTAQAVADLMKTLNSPDYDQTTLNSKIDALKKAMAGDMSGLLGENDKVIDSYEQQIMDLQLQQKLIRMSARGVQEHVIAQEQLVATANKYFAIVENGRKLGVEALTTEEKQQVISELLKGNWETISDLKKRGIIDEQQALNLANQLLDIDRKRLELIQRYGDQVKSAFQTTLADALKEGNFEAFFSNFGERLRSIILERVAEAFTENLLAQTGIFDAFGQVLSGQQLGQVIVTSGQQHAQMVQQAIITAGTQHAQMIGQASATASATTASTGVTGLGTIGGVPAGYTGKTATVEGLGTVPVKPASQFNALGALATLGMFASLFAGSGSKVSSGHTYSTAPGGVDKNLTATTRMTTKAQITNITIAPTFNVKGDITDQRVRNAIADDIIKQIKDGVVQYLDEQNIAVGNV